MITITLDEQGDFENLRGELDIKPVFIGGIVFDGDEDALKAEMVRLKKYFKGVCRAADAYYPRDLHCAIQGERNNEMVGKVKQELNRTLHTFFGDKNRKGKYHIFAMLRGENGDVEKHGNGAGEAVREDFASNLYANMAEEIMIRLILHNPVIADIDRVHLDFATRRVVLTGEQRAAKEKEYIQLGFRPVTREGGNEDRAEFVVTNSESYRTALQQEMRAAGKGDIAIDKLRARCIVYKPDNDDMVFLYLADAVCSYLGYHAEKETEKQWIDSFAKMADRINQSGDNLVFSYGAVDRQFQAAWSYLEKKDYYNALNSAFDVILMERSTVSDYYTKKWIPVIRSAVEKERDYEKFAEAVDMFHKSLFRNNLNQEKLVYIYTALEAVGEQMPKSDNKPVLYRLYTAGMSVYTHIGDSAKAEECSNKCRANGQDIGISLEQMLGSKKTEAVFTSDSFYYDKALEITNHALDLHKFLSEEKSDMLGVDSVKTTEYIKCLSQRGQVYSCMKDIRAETDYMEAINLWGGNDANRLITTSYLLHHYLYMAQCGGEGYREKYEEVSKNYFGGRTKLDKRFNDIVRNGVKGSVSLKFALYVYVRAVYVFYSDPIDEKVFNKLSDIEAAITKLDPRAKEELNGHPWELIYKYLALIMLKCGEDDIARGYLDKIDTCAQKQGATVDIIAAYGKAEIYRALNEEENVKVMLAKVTESMKGVNSLLWEELIKPDALNDKMDYLKDKVLTFMYC